MALTDKLTAIGVAIREKTGKSDLLTLDQMPLEIASITTGGGGGEVPDDALRFTGTGQYLFAENRMNWLIENYGNRIVTEGLTSPRNIFANSFNLEYIPFTIDFNVGSYGQNDYMFDACYALKEFPICTGKLTLNNGSMFSNCHNIRHIPQEKFAGVTWITERVGGYGQVSSNYSLREFPNWLFSLIPTNTKASYGSACYWYGIHDFYAMDEIVDLPIPYRANAFTSNYFSTCFYGFYRLKNFTFETDNGQPLVLQWKSQVLDLARCEPNPIGVAATVEAVTTRFNSGITPDKEVKDDATYQALKNDPDWFTCDRAYSRYNHDSAVATINSLPDCSAYGTNTIKFIGELGSKTDGGAINTLTEEEIAVATAKGWTVTLV